MLITVCRVMAGDDNAESRKKGYTGNDTSTFHFIAAVNLVVSQPELIVRL